MSEVSTLYYIMLSFTIKSIIMRVELFTLSEPAIHCYIVASIVATK